MRRILSTTQRIDGCKASTTCRRCVLQAIELDGCAVVLEAGAGHRKDGPASLNESI